MELLVGIMLLLIMTMLLEGCTYCLIDAIKTVIKHEEQKYLLWCFVFLCCVMLCVLSIILITTTFLLKN